MRRHGLLAALLLVGPAAAQARTYYLIGVEGWQGDGAADAARQDAAAAARAIVASGYDSGTSQVTATRAGGVRLGANWSPGEDKLAFGADQPPLELGASLGLVVGPRLRGGLRLESASRGDASFDCNVDMLYGRLLLEARLRPLARDSGAGPLLVFGWGPAWVRSSATSTPRGSLAAGRIQGHTEKRLEARDTWEVSAGWVLPWGRRRWEAGLRYARFPRLTRRARDGVASPVSWRPFGLWLSRSF